MMLERAPIGTDQTPHVEQRVIVVMGHGSLVATFKCTDCGTFFYELVVAKKTES